MKGLSRAHPDSAGGLDAIRRGLRVGDRSDAAGEAPRATAGGLDGGRGRGSGEATASRATARRRCAGCGGLRWRARGWATASRATARRRCAGCGGLRRAPLASARPATASNALHQSGGPAGEREAGDREPSHRSTALRGLRRPRQAPAGTARRRCTGSSGLRWHASAGREQRNPAGARPGDRSNALHGLRRRAPAHVGEANSNPARRPRTRRSASGEAPVIAMRRRSAPVLLGRPAPVRQCYWGSPRQ